MLLRTLVLAAVLSIAAAAITEVAAPATLPFQNATTGYTVQDLQECMSDSTEKGYGFDKYSGGVPTITNCVARCEATTNCVGFQFVYGADRTFDCAPSSKTDCSAASGLAGGRTKTSFWIRDAGGVVAGSEGPRAGWVGDGPAAQTGYVPFAGSDCTGSDNGVIFESADAKTDVECAAACTADVACFGFNYNWKDDSSTYKRCVGKKVDCTLVSGREAMTYYAKSDRTGGGGRHHGNGHDTFT